MPACSPRRRSGPVGKFELIYQRLTERSRKLGHIPYFAAVPITYRKIIFIHIYKYLIQFTKCKNGMCPVFCWCGTRSPTLKQPPMFSFKKLKCYNKKCLRQQR